MRLGRECGKGLMSAFAGQGQKRQKKCQKGHHEQQEREKQGISQKKRKREGRGGAAGTRGGSENVSTGGGSGEGRDRCSVGSGVRMIGKDRFGLASKLMLWTAQGVAERKGAVAVGMSGATGAATEAGGTESGGPRYEVMQIGAAAGYPFSGLCVHRTA
jgi:hypothetical protein